MNQFDANRLLARKKFGVCAKGGSGVDLPLNLVRASEYHPPPSKNKLDRTEVLSMFDCNRDLTAMRRDCDEVRYMLWGQ